MVTTIPAPTQKPVDFQPVIRRRRWTRDEYHQMGEAGVIGPDERVELIDGEVVQSVAPIGIRHREAVDRVIDVLKDRLGKDFYVSAQQPIVISENNEPVPDILILSGKRSNYNGKAFTPSDMSLVIEISDSSLLFDRSSKALLYSTAGIIEYWIINIPEQKLEMYRSPQGDLGYQSAVSISLTENVSALFAPQLSFAVSQFFKD
jgi:Uma2 family endonuclease